MDHFETKKENTLSLSCWQSVQQKAENVTRVCVCMCDRAQQNHSPNNITTCKLLLSQRKKKQPNVSTIPPMGESLKDDGIARMLALLKETYGSYSKLRMVCFFVLISAPCDGSF
jgi:hypothetical protein